MAEYEYLLKQVAVNLASASFSPVPVHYVSLEDRKKKIDAPY